MMLELISNAAKAGPDRPPLLFVHGGFHGAWCWAEHYLPFFEAHEWPAHALSLRGHGQSEGADRIEEWSLSDYAADVMHVSNQIGGPVILVGHSMGGVISQMCWRDERNIAGMVLLASSPLRPSLSVVLRLLSRNPHAFLMGQLRKDPALLREAMAPFFLSPDLPDEDAQRYHQQLSLESPRALDEIFSRSAPIPNRGDRRPVHIIAGRDDWSIPLSAHEPFVETYAASFEVCPGYHDLMLDPHWEDGARSIVTWLERHWPTPDHQGRSAPV